MKKRELTSEIAKILRIAPKNRAHAIIDSPLTQEILESLPTQDAYLIIKEAFGADSEILLQYTPPEKICNFIDLDCWDGDMLSLESLFAWIAELSQASPETLLKVLEIIDPEIIILLFQPYLKVVITSPTDDIIPELIEEGFETFDNNYFFSFHEETEETSVLRNILDILLLHHPDMHYRILAGVRWELPSNMEETAFQHRSIRLIELGFLPPDEAKSVYQRLRTDKIIARRLRPEEVPRPGDEEYFIPTPYSDMMHRKDLITATLEGVNETTRQRFLFAMVNLTNKIIMADYKPLNDPETVRASTEKAMAITALGLHIALRARGESAQAIVDAMNAETFFSLGYNSLLELQQRTKGVLKGVRASMIPLAYREHVDGLLKKSPVYMGHAFTSLEELDLVTASVDQLDALRRILRHIPWKGHPLKNTNIGLEGLDMENIILTALAVNIATEELTFRPLASDELAAFFKHTTAMQNHQRRCRPEFKNDLFTLLHFLDDSIPEYTLHDTTKSLIKRFEDEVSGLEDLRHIDTRYLTCLVVNL